MFFLSNIKETMILPIARLKYIEQAIPEFYIGNFIKGKGLCIAINSFKIIETHVIRGEGDLDVKVRIRNYEFS